MEAMQVDLEKTVVAEITSQVSEAIQIAKKKVVETAAKVAPVIKSGIETAKTAQVTEPSAVPALPLSTSVVDTRIEQFAKTEQQLKKLQSEIEEFKKKNKGLTDLPGPSELDAFSDDNTVEGYKDSELNNKFSELKSKLRDTETNKRKLIQDEIAQQAVFVKPRTITRKGRRGARQREAAKKVAKIRNDVRLLELGQRKGIVTTEKDADGAISFTYKEKDAIKNAIEKEMQEKSKQIGMTAKDATKQTSPEVSEAIKTAQVTEPVIDTKQTSPEVSEAIKTAQVTEPSAVPVIKSGIKSTKDVGKGWADKIANSLKLSNLLGGLTKDIVELTSPEITEAVKTAKEKLIEVTAKPVSVIKSGVKTVGNVVKLAKNKVTETAKDIIELTSPQITDVVKTAKEKITKVTAKTAPVIKSGITQLASRVSETAKAAKDKVVKPVAKSKSKRPSREWGTFEEDVSDIIRPVVKSKRTNRDSLGDLVDDGGNFKPTVTAPVIKSGIAQLASRVSETTKAAKFKVGKTASVTKDIVNQTSPQVSEAIKTAKVNVVKSPVKVALTEEELRAEFNTTHGESFREKEDAITAKYAKPKGGRRARDEMNVSFDQMDDEWELDDEKAIAYAKFKEERLVAGKAQDITTQKFKNITGSIKTVSAAQGVYIKPRISTESFPAELHPNEAVLPLNDIRSQKAIGESISKSIATAPRPVTEIKPVPIIQPQQPAIPQQTQSVTPPPAPVPATTNETESITDAVTQQFIDKIFTNTINVFQQSIKTFAMGQSPFMV